MTGPKAGVTPAEAREYIAEAVADAAAYLRQVTDHIPAAALPDPEQARTDVAAAEAAVRSLTNTIVELEKL